MASKRKHKQSTHYLYFDTVSSRDLILVLFSTKGEVLARRVVTGGSRTELLLPALLKFVGRRKIAGLAVAQGSGSFTHTPKKLQPSIYSDRQMEKSGSTKKTHSSSWVCGFTQARLACAIGNALAYAWGVPALSVSVSATAVEVARRLVRAPRRSLALPQYRAPAVS